MRKATLRTVSYPAGSGEGSPGTRRRVRRKAADRRLQASRPSLTCRQPPMACSTGDRARLTTREEAIMEPAPIS